MRFALHPEELPEVLAVTTSAGFSFPGPGEHVADSERELAESFAAHAIYGTICSEGCAALV